jgi:hypothetical protein
VSFSGFWAHLSCQLICLVTTANIITQGMVANRIWRDVSRTTNRTLSHRHSAGQSSDGHVQLQGDYTKADPLLRRLFCNDSSQHKALNAEWMLWDMTAIHHQLALAWK